MYKNSIEELEVQIEAKVSILVLMDLCIKTLLTYVGDTKDWAGFNPCFNGSMYKNIDLLVKYRYIDLFQSLF